MTVFVKAEMIAERLCWPRRDGQERLPELVGKLIKSSILREAIKEYRFPSPIYLPGPDGILVVDDAVQHPFIPAGISLWEMGTSMDPKSKADDDFKDAADKLAKAFPNAESPVTPEKATFVFVTSKPWDSSGWIREKRQISTWQSIRVIDAVALEEWLGQCVA
ncbi:unnamed protein product, partial [marine sediment metagenome]